MLTPQDWFAFDPQGRVYVAVSGHEVRVHRGGDDRLIWTHSLPTRVVGVAAGGDSVVTLEECGLLTWRSRVVNTTLQNVQLRDLDEAPTALAATPDARLCAVVAGDAVLLVGRAGSLVRIEAMGATAVALSADGRRVAIGDSCGTVRVLSAEGDVLGTCSVRGEVTSLCWSSAGYWFAAGVDAVYRFGRNGGVAVPLIDTPGLAPSHVCVSGDGTVLALRLGEHLVMGLTLPEHQTALQLQYVDRTVVGLAFGRGRVLGVGLHDGHANVVDLTAGRMRRTPDDVARAPAEWMVKTTMRPEVLPPAVAKAGSAARPELWFRIGMGVLAMAGLAALMLR